MAFGRPTAEHAVVLSGVYCKTCCRPIISLSSLLYLDTRLHGSDLFCLAFLVLRLLLPFYFRFLIYLYSIR